MASRQEWDQIKPEILAGVNKYYPYYHQNCTVSELPRECLLPDIMEMRGQKKGYSCSLEMSHLSRAIYHLPELSDKDVSRAIKMTTNGADQLDIYRALKDWNIPCEAYENMPVSTLRERLDKRESVFLWSGQQPYAKKRDIEQGDAGHYMMLCCGDEDYGYYADPGYVAGKTRILWEYLPYLWFDGELATRRIIYQFAIEIMLPLAN